MPEGVQVDSCNRWNDRPDRRRYCGRDLVAVSGRQSLSLRATNGLERNNQIFPPSVSDDRVHFSEEHDDLSSISSSQAYLVRNAPHTYSGFPARNSASLCWALLRLEIGSAYSLYASLCGPRCGGGEGLALYEGPRPASDCT